MGEQTGRRRTALRATIAGLALAGTVALASSASPVAAQPRTTKADAGSVVELLPLQTSSDRRIVDSSGRDVILRGANLNSLGEYWQGVPGIDPTIPVTDADWDSMAAHGFSVVRLLITWSRVEPTKGTFDAAYLDQVDAAVTAAATRGIYSVIDMHQDAYTAFLHTTDPSSCPSGSSPAKGWDGAPSWAVLSDGLSTCVTGSGERNSSPAVNRAWNNFYDNTSGIRDEFVKAWKFVAGHFAGRPEVAGYDLLNEPEVPRPAAEFTAVYSDFLADVITGVRHAEASAPFGHLMFIEPALPAGDPSRGLVIPDPKGRGISTENLVAAAHNYAESISVPGLDLGIEGTNTLIDSVASGLGVPVWGGEYGFWDTSPSTLEKAARYAADEDRHAWGGAWWQWRQSCGDPHAVQWSGNQVVAPTGPSIHLNQLGCPGNTDLGPTHAFLDILGRGYARATPGRITQLVSDPKTGHLKVKATVAKPGGTLEVWSPTSDDAAHPINVFGLTDVVSHPVDGGRIITATVAVPGTYALWIGPADEDLSTTTTTTSTTSTPGGSGNGGGATPAVPVAGTADFTG
jgi:endoglycosylceramidase